MNRTPPPTSPAPATTGPTTAGQPDAPRRLIVAITGATGAAYGVRLLQMLREAGVHTHLVVTASGWLSLSQELDIERRAVEALAGSVHPVRDIGAPIASGSFRTDGMVIAPCSMKTLAAIAHGLSDNLVTRAADVALKERRRLVLLARETPLNLVHLRNMTAVTEAGGIVFPPLPAFYHRPATIADLVAETCGRVLDLFGLAPPEQQRWQGLGRGAGPAARSVAGNDNSNEPEGE